MSMFFCHRCDNLADSDDDCKEGPRFSLICIDCMDNEPEAEGVEAGPPSGNAASTPDSRQDKRADDEHARSFREPSL